MENAALKLNFAAPASYWTDAIPIGNGRLGAMIWGGVPNETLQLNDDTLWTGIPGDYTDPNAPAALSEVRKLVSNAQFPEASLQALQLSGNSSEAYQALGDLVLQFDASHLKYDPQSYRRELDLDNATATVSYTVGDVEYTRVHFASNPDQAILTRISASKPGALSFTLYLDSKMEHTSFVQGNNQIVLQGSCRGDPKGIQFSAMLDLQIGGAAVVSVLDGKKLKVEGADWVVLLLVASSTFDGPFTSPVDSTKDPSSDCQKALNSLTSWSGAQHLNINLQMNYWPALPCNLEECQEPLFDYISSLSVNYGASGWVAHQVSDLWAKTSPDSGNAVWALWPMGGAWLCTHLWEHFSYTMDKEFLQNKAYPLLEGCTKFLLDWLIETPGGNLGTNPSTSPEHMFIAPDGKQASVSYSSTMDMAITREVFSEIVAAAEVVPLFYACTMQISFITSAIKVLPTSFVYFTFKP
ncbi:Alpha-L-fucosidase 2 [Linum perenne]